MPVITLYVKVDNDIQLTTHSRSVPMAATMIPINIAIIMPRASTSAL